MSQSSLQLHSQCLFLYYHSLLVSPSLGCSTGTKRTKKMATFSWDTALAQKPSPSKRNLYSYFPKEKEDFHWVKLLHCQGFVVWQSYVKLSLKGCHFLMSSACGWLWYSVISLLQSLVMMKTQPSTVKEGPVGSESSSAQNIQWFCVSFPCPPILYKLWKIWKEVRVTGISTFSSLQSMPFTLSP